MNSNSPQQPPILFVGIDWADKEHAVWCQSNEGSSSESETLPQDSKAIAKWVGKLEKRFPGHQIMIALEQSRGALIAALAQFHNLLLYPINPKQLASYRDAIHPSGSKNDPGDASLLAKFLQYHHEQLRPWQPDDEQTCELGELAELRRKLVEERKRLVLQLNSSLKQYFPLILQLCNQNLNDPLILDLLQRWPSLEELQSVHPLTLRTFLKEHGMRNRDQQTELIETIRGALPLTRNQALIRPRARYVQTLVRQIRELRKSIAEFDEQLRQQATDHPDNDLFRSAPGAGEVLAPRLIAAFGSDRDRYESPEEIQCYSGIAPITKQSGSSKVVQRRLACPKFLRQTFHEFADQARKYSRWSKAFYKMKKSQGMKHHAALRALAYKWIRIFFRLWKTNTLYSEDTYIKQLQSKNSPVIQFLDP
jgi:transposase